MKLLDQYIVGKFLKTYLFVVLILVSVICVIDFTEKNEDFIQHNLGASDIVMGYYRHLFPYWASLLSPITVFIATVFVTAQMASHTEVIAILSSGVSFRRMMVPYLIGSALIGMLNFALVSYVIPNSNKVRIAFERKYVKSPFYFEERNIHLKVAPNTYVYMDSYTNVTNSGYRFTMEDIEGTTLKRKLESERITWDSTKRKWQIANYKLRTFEGDRETLSYGTGMDTVLNLKPKDFDSNYMLYETFTLPELDDFIRELQSRGSDGVVTYQIEKYVRFTSPFAIIILCMIGVIVSARKSRGGVGFQIAFGFVLAFVYIIFFIMTKTIAEVGGLNPIVGVWIPNVVFALVGVLLYKTVPR
ncbi:MAG: LptF/LptG family permease [Ferruginibacter sp.]|nr:LptF/LptG family permease [Cytophagales bacterium]